MELSVAQIADKLTPGQRSTVMGLDDEFCILGCSEPTAIRLTVDRTRRPALVKEGPRLDEFRTFALTDLGALVRKCLVETCDHSKHRPIQKMRCYICGGCRRVLDRREATILAAAWDGERWPY